jgi:hypothetical protein
MKRKSIQEINFSPCQNRHNKGAEYKKRMPIARCVCGFEVLVLPDLKAMNLAINNHLTVHDGSAEGLTEQVLIVASKMNLAT